MQLIKVINKKGIYMEFVIGILLILTFFALAYYCVKGYNLTIGFGHLCLWTILSLLGRDFPQFIADNPNAQFGGDGGKDWWPS